MGIFVSALPASPDTLALDAATADLKHYTGFALKGWRPFFSTLWQKLPTDLLLCWLDFKVGFTGVNEEPLNFDIFSFVFHVELKLWIGKQLLESVLVSYKELYFELHTKAHQRKNDTSF